MSNVGFIGLGIMGTPMAANLIKGGHTLFLPSRSGVPEALLDAGGRACTSAKDVARLTDVIILLVPDTPLRLPDTTTTRLPGCRMPTAASPRPTSVGSVSAVVAGASTADSMPQENANRARTDSSCAKANSGNGDRWRARRSAVSPVRVKQHNAIAPSRWPSSHAAASPS